MPSPSPTTTSAVKLKRRPPLTTLATRLIVDDALEVRALLRRGRRAPSAVATVAGRVAAAGAAAAALGSWHQMFLVSCYVRRSCAIGVRTPVRLRGRRRRTPRSRPWYLLPPRSKTTGSTPAALARSATELADLAWPWRSCRRRAAQVGLEGRGRRQRVARDVVDDLHEDVPRRAGDDQARTRRRTGDLLADPEVRGACARRPCTPLPLPILTLMP